jgi:hypothetical protein
VGGIVTDIRNDIAGLIRDYDADNTMTATLLGKCLGRDLGDGGFVDLYADDIIRFVERVNPDKTMSVGALADAVVDHFKLDEEA